MLLSLDQPVAKNQILNTKCQLRFFVVITIQKEKRQPGLFSFHDATTTKKTFSWHLLFSIRFLVTG